MGYRSGIANSIATWALAILNTGVEEGKPANVELNGEPQHKFAHRQRPVRYPFGVAARPPAPTETVRERG
jgi:hypothetical protein